LQGEPAAFVTIISIQENFTSVQGGPMKGQNDFQLPARSIYISAEGISMSWNHPSNSFAWMPLSRVKD
jgi:hypothetical protein